MRHSHRTRNTSDHRSSRYSISRIRATDPRGQDVDTRSEDSNGGPIIGERRKDIIAGNSADGVCTWDAGWRVIGSIVRVISAGDQEELISRGKKGNLNFELNAATVKCNPPAMA